jgi:hypothetical protein
VVVAHFFRSGSDGADTDRNAAATSDQVVKMLKLSPVKLVDTEAESSICDRQIQGSTHGRQERVLKSNRGVMQYRHHCCHDLLV